MNILCLLGFHKQVKTNPEKGLVSEVKCSRLWCDKIIHPEIIWPRPLPLQTIQPFPEHSQCPICHSYPTHTYFCQGTRWDLEIKYPHFINQNLRCPYGEKGHLHRKCSCGFEWVEKTALDTEGENETKNC